MSSMIDYSKDFVFINFIKRPKVYIESFTTIHFFPNGKLTDSEMFL